jgi:hypothetical protein
MVNELVILKFSVAIAGIYLKDKRCLLYLPFDLEVEAMPSLKTSINLYQTTHHNPECSSLSCVSLSVVKIQQGSQVTRRATYNTVTDNTISDVKVTVLCSNAKSG